MLSQGCAPRALASARQTSRGAPRGVDQNWWAGRARLVQTGAGALLVRSQSMKRRSLGACMGDRRAGMLGWTAAGSPLGRYLSPARTPRPFPPPVGPEAGQEVGHEEDGGMVGEVGTEVCGAGARRRGRHLCVRVPRAHAPRGGHQAEVAQGGGLQGAGDGQNEYEVRVGARDGPELQLVPPRHSLQHLRGQGAGGRGPSGRRRCSVQQAEEEVPAAGRMSRCMAASRTRVRTPPERARRPRQTALPLTSTLPY